MLKEEVKAEGLIRHYEPFTRFLQVLATSEPRIVGEANISDAIAPGAKRPVTLRRLFC